MAVANGLDPQFDKVGGRRKIISGQGATRTLSENESGAAVLFDRAAGIVYTLPAAAKVGTYFDFFVTTSITSNAAKVITAAGTEFLLGGLMNIDTDTSNAVAAWTANGSTHVSVSMNGTTTGGLAGTWLRVTALNSTQWGLQGIIQGNGTVATPVATS